MYIILDSIFIVAEYRTKLVKKRLSRSMRAFHYNTRYLETMQYICTLLFFSLYTFYIANSPGLDSNYYSPYQTNSPIVPFQLAATVPTLRMVPQRDTRHDRRFATSTFTSASTRSKLSSTVWVSLLGLATRVWELFHSSDMVEADAASFRKYII
jgi:hypothetical protein